MNLRQIAMILATYLLACVYPSHGYGTPSNIFSELGVNLAGAEFGTSRNDFSNQNPGQYNKDYVYPDLKTMQYFASNDIHLFRIPFRWERIQPQLGKPLDPDELARLRGVIQDASIVKSHIILDLHNYARYRIKSQGKVVDAIVGDTDPETKVKVTVDDLCDLWQRLAREFKNHPTVTGYGIMNEPHDMPKNGTSWHEISRAVVRAIRAVDPTTTILVPGDRWSSARFFPEANGPTPWIDRNIPNIIYEAHLYFDRDGSGTYPLDYNQTLRQNAKLPQSGSDYVRPFIDWCKRNQVQGFIGEFGIPAEPGWIDVMEDFIHTIRRNGVGGCYWAAGPWWGDYPLSIQPDQKTWKHKPQMEILKGHTSDGSE